MGRALAVSLALNLAQAVVLAWIVVLVRDVSRTLEVAVAGDELPAPVSLWRRVWR